MPDNDLRRRAQRLREATPKRPGAEPPRETGRRLATLGRGTGEELRVNWCEYEGKPYLGVRLWTQGRDGSWWPSKTGCTIRVRELADFAEAVAEAIDLAEQHQRTHAGWGPGQGGDGPPGGPSLSGGSRSVSRSDRRAGYRSSS